MVIIIMIVIAYLLGMLCFRVLETESVIDWWKYAEFDTTQKTRKIIGAVICFIPILNVLTMLTYTIILTCALMASKSNFKLF